MLHPPRSARLAFICLSITIAFPAVALADAVFMNNGITYSGVRITGVKDGEIQFETAGGNATNKPMKFVTRISMTDEPALNAAEEAYARSEWSNAAENYEKAMRSANNPTKAWLRDWCSLRLADAAGKGGRFDVSVRSFIDLAKKSPDQAKTMFADLKMPKAGSDYLKQAAASLETEISQSRNDATTEVLLSALKDIYTANNDSPHAAATATKLAEIAARRNPNSPEAIRALLDIKLQKLHNALAAKQYATVIETIDKETPNINDPFQAVDALFLLAEARAGKAAGTADADWKDIAIAYMRVIANAKPDDPHVPAALLRVAAIHADHLKEKDTAIKLYNGIIKDYKDTDAAKEAQKAVAQLGK